MKTSPEVAQENTAFVLNNIYISARLPYKFSCGIVLRKATQNEIVRIKQVLKAFSNDNEHFSNVDLCFEHEIIETKKENGSSGEFIKLPPNKWKYYVITYDPLTDDNLHLQLSANLTNTPLNVMSCYFLSQRGYGYNWSSLSKFFEHSRTRPSVEVTRANLLKITQIYNLLISVSENYPEIKRGLTMFNDLDSLPKNSAFNVLGLFAIIEMLISHNPKLEDRGDSITHQIKTKIPLLRNRFINPVNYAEFFSDSLESKIWGSLYSYRSVIAHGGIPNFASTELRILKDASNTINFLRQFVMDLLFHSLEEPKLFQDLRNC